MVAFLPVPSVAAAVIFTDFFLPAFNAFTFPEDETVAYLVLLLVHFNFLLAPFVAVTFALRLNVLPALTVFLPVILIFFTSPLAILILIEAFFLLPSLAVAVIVTVFPPAFLLTATVPFLSTVAYLLLLVDHVTALFAALAGVTVAFNLIFLPGATFVVGDCIVIFVTFITCGFGFSVVGCCGFSVVGSSGFGGCGSSFFSTVTVMVLADSLSLL